MLDHVTIRVVDLSKSKDFYDKALAPLGMNIVLGGQEELFWGYGIDVDPIFEISQGTVEEPAHKEVHIAFKAGDQKTVDAFYHEAIAAGGTDHGAPGPRPHYSPTYYAAFVRDPDQNNIEVCYYEK